MHNTCRNGKSFNNTAMNPVQQLMACQQGADLRGLNPETAAAYRRALSAFLEHAEMQRFSLTNIPVDTLAAAFRETTAGRSRSFAMHLRAAITTALFQLGEPRPELSDAIKTPRLQRAHHTLTQADEHEVLQIIEHLRQSSAYMGRLHHVLACTLFGSGINIGILRQLPSSAFSLSSAAVPTVQVGRSNSSLPLWLSDILVDWQKFRTAYALRRVRRAGPGLLGSELMFPALSGAPTSTQSFNLKLNSICQHLGIEKISSTQLSTRRMRLKHLRNHRGGEGT